MGGPAPENKCLGDKGLPMLSFPTETRALGPTWIQQKLCSFYSGYPTPNLIKQANRVSRKRKQQKGLESRKKVEHSQDPTPGSNRKKGTGSNLDPTHKDIEPSLVFSRQLEVVHFTQPPHTRYVAQVSCSRGCVGVQGVTNGYVLGVQPDTPALLSLQFRPPLPTSAPPYTAILSALPLPLLCSAALFCSALLPLSPCLPAPPPLPPPPALLTVHPWSPHGEQR